MHPTPLNADYIRQLIEKSNEYHVDSFEICGQCHTPYGGLDGLIDYREFPHAYANWDQKKVAETQAEMAEILDLAHAAGKKVFYFHREVMIPPGLLEDIPDLLDENREFDLLGERFAQLIRYKIDKVMTKLPKLDGIVLTTSTGGYFSALEL